MLWYGEDEMVVARGMYRSPSDMRTFRRELNERKALVLAEALCEEVAQNEPTNGPGCDYLQVLEATIETAQSFTYDQRKHLAEMVGCGSPSRQDWENVKVLLRIKMTLRRITG